jgi:2-furoyl-CoA dehydrogenase large subunit
MSESAARSVEIGAPPERVWALLEDPAALRRILPGCESLVADGPDRMRAVLASRVAFMTVRADVEVTRHEADPPRHVRLELDGRTRGFGGGFQASVPFDLEPLPGGRTRIDYRVELALSGSLAAVGGTKAGDALRDQIGELVRNVERELAAKPD